MREAPGSGFAVTTVVVAVVLVTGGARLPAWQTPAFALGAAGGVGRSPYGWVFPRAVRPRLGPPTVFEAPEPRRFAQALGLAFAVLAFAVLGLVGFVPGPQRLGLAAAGAAPAAAFLNAAFGYRPGCELHLLVRRVTVRAK